MATLEPATAHNKASSASAATTGCKSVGLVVRTDICITSNNICSFLTSSKLNPGILTSIVGLDDKLSCASAFRRDNTCNKDKQSESSVELADDNPFDEFNANTLTCPNKTAKTSDNQLGRSQFVI